MAELSEAIVKEAPRRRWKPRASHRGDFVASYGRLRIRAWRAEKKVNELQDRLTKLTDSKTVGGRVSEEWITRVILTAPHVSGHALAETFHLAIGSDSNVISRDSIGAIRSAFLEMWKNLLFSSAKDFIFVHRRDIANRTPAALGSGLMFLPLFISHVQDEADIRLLTSNPGSAPGLPRRSRSSKVQVNVVHLRVQGRSWALPHELEALADKSAPVLATCFERLVQAWLAALVPPQAGGRGGSFRHNPEIWMLHCLIGDGIPTNVAAAKILWACRDHVCEQDGTVVRYFLLVGKCGTHQTALSAKNGIVGRVAAAAAGDSTEYEGVTANAVRLFKYLVPDYYEDFKKSVATWVHDYLKVLLPSGAGELPQDRAQAGSLQVLYTKHVIPDELLRLWNHSTDRLQTVLNEDADVEAEREHIENAWVAFVVTHLLQVDNKPTLTRFFTFRGCVDRMVTMDLLRIPHTALAVKSSAREITQKRLKKVHSFFKKWSASQALRRASLILQLTGGVEGFVSAEPKEGAPPTVAAILQGQAHAIVNERLQRLLGVMHHDPDLDLAAATGALLGTGMDLILRLNAYKKFPYKFCTMCRKWFPISHRVSITMFLQAPAEDLDVGFSLPFQRLALSQGGGSCSAGHGCCQMRCKSSSRRRQSRSSRTRLLRSEWPHK